MPTPVLTGTGADPTHHIILGDGTTELGFVITDQGGDLDEKTFRRFPFATPNDPYVTEKQASFGGGFGQRDFEEDRTKYWLSNGVDTTKEKLVLGPHFQHAVGAWEEANQFLKHSDGVFSWTKLLTTESYLSMLFTTTEAWGTGPEYLKFWIRKTGTPSDLTVGYWSDDGSDAPNAVIGGDTITAAEVVGEHGQWYRATLSQVGLADATKYHVVFSSPSADASNYWEIGGNGTRVAGKKSSDGSTWANSSEDYFYRLTGADSVDHIAKFYEYKGQLYFVSTHEDGSSSGLWMNGWRGACDANAGAYNHLKDATQTGWASLTGDEVAKIVAGPGSGEWADWRNVSSGASGYAVVSPNWLTVHSVYDDYVITNSDNFYKIDAGSTFNQGRVTDLTIANGIVFMCRGQGRQMAAHREYNKDGAWVNDANGANGDNWKLLNARADWAHPVYDQASGQDSLWLGFNSRAAGEYRPKVSQFNPKGWEELNLMTQYMPRHNALVTDSGHWTSSDADVAVGAVNQHIVYLHVTCSKVLTLSVTAGGTGYTVGDTLTLVDSGSSGTATCTVASISGGGGTGPVTGVSAPVVAGYDYTLGVKATTGGTGADCTLEITALDGFTTGQLAYRNLYDEDGTALNLDWRNMDRMHIGTGYKLVTAGGAQILTNGDVELQIDDDANCLSPFATIDIAGITPGGTGAESVTTGISLGSYEGADSISSLGMNLSVAQNKSFILYLGADWWVGYKYEPIDVGLVDGDNLTGLQNFGEPETLWVFTEAGLGYIQNNRFMPVPIRELKVARHPNNGLGNEVHDVYLMFTWKGRLQRYFRQNLEDLGPEFPKDMADIAGDIVSVVTYPGRMYVAVDGGTGGKSLILCHKGGAWHEVYTSFSGERIRELYIQSIPGKSDKLWASVGTSVIWFPITLDSAELPANSDYRYRPNGYLETSWIYTSSMELNKLFRSIIMVRNAANDSDLTTTVFYKIDDEDAAWTKITDIDSLNASAKEYNFSNGAAGASVQGNRLRVRIELSTAVTTKTPVVRSIQTRIYRLPEIRYSWSWLAKASSISINLRGDEERPLGVPLTVAAALVQLDTWAANMSQLVAETGIAAFNGRTVLCEPIPYQLLTIVNDEGIEEDVIQVSVNDI